MEIRRSKNKKDYDVEGGWRVENGRRRFVAGDAGNWRNRSQKEREFSSKKFRNAAQGHYIGMKKSHPQRKCNKEMVWRKSSPVVTNTTFTANLLDDLATLSKEKVPAKVTAEVPTPSRFSAKAQAFYGGLRPKVLAARTAAAKGGDDIPVKADKLPSRRSPLANLLTPSEKRRQRFKDKLNSNPCTIKPPTRPKPQAETPKEQAKAAMVVAAQPKQEVQATKAQKAPPTKAPTPEKKLTLKPSLAQAQCEEDKVAQLCTQEGVKVTLSPARALSRDESLAAAVAVAGAAAAVVSSIGAVPDPTRTRLGISLLVMLCAVAAACGFGLFADLVNFLTPRKN